MGEKIKPVVVISGVNFVEGGPLSIMKDAARAFLYLFSADFSLMLIVNNREVFSDLNGFDIIFYEYPLAKRSWTNRLWFEYVKCRQISKKVEPWLWLAMHDITPNVFCKRKAVYCHNPAPFYKVSLKEAKTQPSLLLFSLFYKQLYRINLKTNNYVIVQQSWLREHFLTHLKAKRVVVAHPEVSLIKPITKISQHRDDPFTFVYPAFPRVFKNFEVLLDATELLSALDIDFRVFVTLDGSENKYAHSLVKKYAHLKQVNFIGLQPRHKVMDLYDICDALVFPSKLETWGLPISEMKLFGKPMLVADKEYARETVGDYPMAKFFDADRPSELSDFMLQMINKTVTFDMIEYNIPSPPYAKNWSELMTLLMN